MVALKEQVRGNPVPSSPRVILEHDLVVLNKSGRAIYIEQANGLSIRLSELIKQFMVNNPGVDSVRLVTKAYRAGGAE
ncbi:MAG: hypothetical protein ABFD91_04125 [Anaerohalosphaeraceae bacterium]